MGAAQLAQQNVTDTVIINQIRTSGQVYNLSADDIVYLKRYNVSDVVFQSTWANFLVKERPAVVERYFTLVETTDAQVAITYAEGKLLSVIGPGKRVLFWRGAITAPPPGA